MSLIIQTLITTGPISTEQIDTIVIRRLEPLDNPASPDDEIHEYVVNDYGQPTDPVKVHHRYGDGHRALVHTALGAILDRPNRAIADVLAERARQDARWGAGSADKNPDGTGPHTRPLYAHTATGIADDDEAHYIRDVLQGRVDWRAANDGTADRPLTHADIFLEEVAEALAEDDPAKLRAELIQAAAYAVKWIEAIDRRAAGEQPGPAQ